MPAGGRTGVGYRLRAMAVYHRDHLIDSLALGNGLRLAEIVGLNVGDIDSTDGTPRSRVRSRPEIAKVRLLDTLHLRS